MCLPVGISPYIEYGKFTEKHLVDPNLEDGKDNVLTAMGKVL